MKNVEILYEDDFIVIINKPAGLAVQGGKDIKVSLDKLLAEHYSSQNGSPVPLLVHRLDKDTSGALLAAKGRESAGRFSKIFGAYYDDSGHYSDISGSYGEVSGNKKKAVKIYTAVCAGRPDKNKGIITEKLIIHGKPKDAETKYKTIKTNTLKVNTEFNMEYSILEIELGTGRMHQIRRHLAMNGNPVLGDDKYGDFQLNKKLKKELGLKRLLLHASRLIIKTENELDICAPLPEYFKQYI